MNIPKRRFIRPGQRHYYRKGTFTQIDQRRGFVARLLDAGASKTEIHRAMRDKFNIQWRQCDRYIAFVTGAHTGTDTRLARVRVEHTQNAFSEMAKNMRIILGDDTK